MKMSNLFKIHFAYKISILLIVALTLAVIAGLTIKERRTGNLMNSSNSNQQEDDKVKYIAVTGFPIYSITKQITDYGNIGVIDLLPQSASPHNFSLSAYELSKLEDVDLLLLIGLGLDNWAIEARDSVNPNLKSIDLSSGVNLRYIKEHNHEEENQKVEQFGDADHEDGEEELVADPHYWLSTENGKIIAKSILEQAIQLDPENKDIYTQNYDVLIANIKMVEDELNLLKSELEQGGISIEDKGIITIHDGFGYMADQIGVEVVATIEEFPGESPSAEHINSVIEELQEHNLKVIFSEPQLSDTVAQTFARDYGITVQVLDPLGGVSLEANTYQKLLQINHKIIIESLR